MPLLFRYVLGVHIQNDLRVNVQTFMKSRSHHTNIGVKCTPANSVVRGGGGARAKRAHLKTKNIVTMTRCCSSSRSFLLSSTFYIRRKYLNRENFRFPDLHVLGCPEHDFICP